MVMEIVISVTLLFVGIAVLVVIHVCIVGRAFGRGNRGAPTMVDIAARSNKTRVSIEDLKTIPCFDYVASATSLVDCAVCLESFEAGDKCRSLPSCGHSFHAQCIDSWLLKTPICPICRTCVILGQERSEIELL